MHGFWVSSSFHARRCRVVRSFPAVLILALFALPALSQSPAPQPSPVREYQEDGWKVSIRRKPPKVPHRLPVAAEGQPGEEKGRFAGFEPEVPTPTLPPTPVPPDPSTVIVAAVDGRRLTRAELNRRSAALLKKAQILMKVSPGTIEYEEVRNRQEGALVQDWMERVLLAEEAKRRGIIPDAKEFEKRFQEKIESQDGKEEYENTLKVLGMTPEEVRAEFYDSLLGDKVVEQDVREYANDEYLRSKYDRSPKLFYRPEQVHVLHYSQALEGTESRKDLRALMDRMEGLRKRIAKGESPAEIAEEEGGQVLGAAGLDLGWIEPTIQSLPMEVQEAVAGLKPGETSKVILSEDGRGRAQALHVAKVVDKRPVAGDTFETAKPLMLESLKESVRISTLNAVKASGKHEIRVNLAGIPQDVMDGTAKARSFSAARDLPAGGSSTGNSGTTHGPRGNPSTP